MLQTERTVVDLVSLSDAPFFAALMSSPDWIRFIGDRDVSDENALREHLRNGYLRSYEENGFGYYVVRIKQRMLPIGICGFLKRESLENPDFGFALLPEYVGHGYAQEFSAAVLNFGIAKFDFHVLDAVTVSENVWSIKLLKKLGFSHVGMVAPTDDSKCALDLYRWQKMA